MITIQALQDSFKVNYDASLPSRIEANIMEELYHNKHYTKEQLYVLAERGQPAETFNIIKMYTRMLLGYYSTVVNSFKLIPEQEQDTDVVAILNDLTSHVLYKNKFDNMGDEVKRDGFLSGLLSVYLNVEELPKKDKFGRPLYNITIEHVPSHQLIVDAKSRKADYSDAKATHRFRWLSEEELHKTFGKSKCKELFAYDNHLNINESQFEFEFGQQFQGKYKRYDNYLVVHSITEDEDGKSWSSYWSANTILSQKEITYSKVSNPYRITKLNDSNTSGYYGIFLEVKNTLHAINQAIIQIQQMVNTKKALVETNAVKDIGEFTTAFNRVNAVIEVQNLQGIKIENFSADVQQQYIILSSALDRVQKLLGINDSFLGQAFASDSGRKVKLQQNASAMALRYLDTKLDLFYTDIGLSITNLIQQYYNANQVVGIVEDNLVARWVEVNKPLIDPDTGDYYYDVDIDPEDGKAKKDEYGNIIMTPLNDSNTDIKFTDFDFRVESTNYNDHEEKNQLMMETILSGSIGNALMTVNPAGFFQVAGSTIKGMKTKDSAENADILFNTAKMLQPQPHQQEQLGMAGGGNQGGSPKSASLKLPQNTNEG